jgi:hypothetical protein
MPTPTNDTFRIEDGTLIRTVVPRRGKGGAYEHACTEGVFKDVAFAIEQRGGGAFTTEDIRAAIDAPFTQANVAMMFPLDRGCIERGRNRTLRASEHYAYEDALIEYHALKDGSPGAGS